MFKIYYDNDCVFAGDDPTAVQERRGVIAVAQEDTQVGREVLHYCDWYYFKQCRWYGADIHGLFDQLLTYFNEIECVLQGRMMDSEEYEQIIIQARYEPGLPAKSAHRRTERG